MKENTKLFQSTIKRRGYNLATNIYLLGSGILGSLHLTEETKQALQISKHIFVLNPDTSLIEDFKETYSSAQVHDMAYLYKDELYRQDVYKKISELIIETAKDNGPVSFIVHGHPLFLVSASEYTIDLAKENNLSVKILPGISSFDTLMCDLKIDYGYALQFFDSTTLINHNWSLNTEVPLLIFQLSTTNNKEIMLGEINGSALSPLKEHLIKFYPEEHEAYIIHSATQILEISDIRKIKIQDITSKEILLNNRPTLYIPPIDKGL